LGVLGDRMRIAYSREAMHALLALPAPERARAVDAVGALTSPEPGKPSDGALDGLLPLAEGSSFRLAPFSATGDLVVTRAEDTLVVVALCDIIGSLKEATIND
jgi:hypothetical protein